MRIFLSLVVICVVGIIPAVPASANTIQVFLQGGQSNCVGNAVKSGLPAELQSPQTDVPFYFGVSPTQGNIELVNSGLQWIDLQVDSGYDFGPEILFGRTMADALSKPDNQIAIIKYGHGGTGFVSSDSNVWYGGGDAMTAGDGNVYQAFQSTVTSGLTSLAAAHPGATIEVAGMTWIQGEQDAIKEPGDYETDLTNFFSDIRLTYGANLPIAIVQLSDSQTAINTTNLNVVKSAQASIAAADPLIEMVVADGLSVRVTDHIHYDPSAQITIGTQLANKMLDLLGVSYSVCANPPAEDITGPEGLPDCRVDFYDFTTLAADWLTLGTGGGGTLPTPATLEVTSAAPGLDIIFSGGIGGPNYTRIFDPSANDNHGRGNMFFTPDAGSDWTMTSLAIRKNTTQTFSNGTLKLWVFEGTKEDWDKGDGDGDGDLFDGTGITNILVNGETFTVNGSIAADYFVTLNLSSSVMLAKNGNYGFMLKYDQGGDSNTYFQVYQYNYPGGNPDVDGYQTQLKSADNIFTGSPLTYYVLGFTSCPNPSIADISGPTGQPDCVVDIYDLAAFSAAWLDCGLDPVDFCWQ